MTDDPRFEPITCLPEDAHQSYYGGKLVKLVFRSVDRWALPRPRRRAPRSRTLEINVLIALVLLAGTIAGLSKASFDAFASRAAAEAPASGTTERALLTENDVIARGRQRARLDLVAPYLP